MDLKWGEAQALAHQQNWNLEAWAFVKLMENSHLQLLIAIAIEAP